ncbi:LTA synthase family protein [Pedobacter deserti]|uniref:LTA synthase family protein n=1 Tax=Pedobacter deserti TaxID=2817382 RepID=UPI00210C16C3|nr:LTA synthase family protein [Pedobacter sp. SYSU D00382]
MVNSLAFFARFFLFWLLFFVVDRLSFLLINMAAVSQFPLSETASVFVHALALDLSMCGYILVIPLLVFSFALLSGRKELGLRWLSFYDGFLVVIFSIISVANFNIYREWGTKMNAKAIDFAFGSPGEALASSASSPVFLTLFTLAVLIAFGLVLHRFVMPSKLRFGRMALAPRILVVLLLFFGTFVMIRGGLKGSPMKQSMAYFSKEQILNHAAVNTPWNLLSSVLSSGKITKNPYVYLKPEQASAYVDSIYRVSKDTTVSILKNKRPNVVLIIIESFGADLTMTLGNEPGITPNFDAMIREGVLFSRIYASGSRTDKGIIATLAGFPTLAASSMMKWPDKMQKLPAISQSLFKQGYQTSFYYGGESEFDNYKAFILSHHYSRLVDRNNFDTPGKSTWGQFDEAVFSKQIAELRSEKQPFFSTLLTLTNHEPYVVPGKPKFGSADNKAKFKSTAFYTDSCIQAYIAEAKKQPWYSNTLFVFVADHAHAYPKDRFDVAVPERYHIPLLFYGEVIDEAYRGKQFDVTGSQTDLAATLLAQLALPAKDFRWSKNLLNPSVKPSAFFSWDNGSGFIYNKHYVTFDHVGQSVLHNSDEGDKPGSAEVLNMNKAYLQMVYQEFTDL